MAAKNVENGKDSCGMIFLSSVPELGFMSRVLVFHISLVLL